jgi:hypothetical protein
LLQEIRDGLRRLRGGHVLFHNRRYDRQHLSELSH